METPLAITRINDFLFCPRSVFFSGIFRNSADPSLYQGLPQIRGTAAHQTIDEGTHSSGKDILCGWTVYSEYYNLMGRIDLFNRKTGLLTERKYAVSALYDGFKYQLFAQYFALTEMGFTVRALCIHSVKDNKTYSVPLPGDREKSAFENVLRDIRSYSMDVPFLPNEKKCRRCIYSPLCDAVPDNLEPA